ncbi:hypothetical protein BKG84_25855 [Mycobacteroides chelonae]|uniref:Uncharacterized protein n=2 Tax=Mycobacteroides chelonae TaxID=1774 RepID=A0A1S1LZQ1_MYCCH|nr:hypothetical protein BKG84_25855 [Mycobacteroides chelonae]
MLGDVELGSNSMTTTPADALKQVSARLAYIAKADAGADPAAALASLLHLVEALRVTVGEHLLATTGDPMRYDDGSPVASVVSLPGGGAFCWVWDPRADSPTNRPHMIMERLHCPDGSEVSVIVSAPGVLDVVQHRAPD